MNPSTWNVGRYIIETLAENGIDTAFGIPGVHNIELYRGLASERVRHVLVRHEQNAAFAADGFARATGRPAAAFVISGPGLTNALTAISQAYSDSVPLLIIASTPTRASLGKGWGVLHELKDQVQLAAGVTAIARSARTQDDVRDHLCAALAALHGPRRRPAYVEVPLDLLAETTALRPQRFAVADGEWRATANGLESALEILNAAARPVIIAGGGARHAGRALSTLTEKLDAYLVTTIAGKGVLPDGHPANLGASLPYGPTQALIAAADVVLAAGTELAETDFYSGTRLNIPGRLIRIDTDPTKLCDHYPTELALLADARTTLETLASCVDSRAPGWRTRNGSAAQLRLQLESELPANTRPLVTALRALRAAVPSDGLVFSDMTQIAYLGNYLFPSDAPDRWFHPTGYGTLGYALPAAIGAKLGAPGRPVVALAGDFGLQFTIAEITTASELEIPLAIVVWNNGALGQIRDDMLAAGIAPVGVVTRNPDFVALAAACGAEAVRARDASNLSQTVRSAFQRRGPTLIEVCASDYA